MAMKKPQCGRKEEGKKITIHPEEDQSDILSQSIHYLLRYFHDGQQR